MKNKHTQCELLGENKKECSIKNIIQFLPYFPPHKGGLETHAEQWAKWWVKKGYGKVYNIITSFDQDFSIGEKILFEGIIIGYKKEGVYNFIVPSIEIISTFPLYKTWGKEYKLIIKYLKTKNIDIIITRTRFFLTSLIGGLFARKNKIEWCHIEHGSDYVKLSSQFKNIIAKIYDKLIGKWIFKKADKLIGVSEACKKFIKKEFVNRDIGVIYRGVDLPIIGDKNFLINRFPDKIIVGFIGRLYKWKNIDSLIKAYYLLNNDLKNKIQIVVVGEGEDFDRLNLLDLNKQVYFTGGKSFNEAIELQSEFDIHFHTSSSGGGLATTLLQAINLGCFIVSTPYEGADEIIVDGKNGILLKNDSVEELERGLVEGVNMIGKKEEFSNYNKKFFREKFSWNENILKYYNLFNEK